jgi:hypothetical protein
LTSGNISADSKIAWLTAGASFRTHFHEAARKTRNTMAFAVGQPKDFREIYRADVPDDTEHWHYNASREVRLDQPAENVYARYVGDPALNNFQVYAHCLDDGRMSAAPVEITHRWTEGGVAKTQSVQLRGKGNYEVLAAGDPVDESIAIAVPSAAR